MADDIRKGGLVRVIVKGPFQDQRVKVLAKNGRYYRLDTTYANTPYPCWFERHEIEPVTEESRGVV